MSYAAVPQSLTNSADVSSSDATGMRRRKDGRDEHAPFASALASGGNDRLVKFAEHKALRIWGISVDVMAVMILSIFSLTISFLFSNISMKVIEQLVPDLWFQVLVVVALIFFFILVMVLIVVSHETERQQHAEQQQQHIVVEHDPLLSHVLAGNVMLTQHIANPDPK